MKTLILIFSIVALIQSRNYPLYKQCDPQWKDQRLGTSPTNTICSAGCLMSSAAMALKGTGHDFNPSTLNKWLTGHNGYAQYDLFIWSSINAFDLKFEGKVANSQIKSKLDQGKIVIINVHGGGHWVLAHAYSGDNIQVNDPGYSVTSYTLSEIVDGQNGIYTVLKGHTIPSAIEIFERAFLKDKRKKTDLMKMADGGQLDLEQTLIE